MPRFTDIPLSLFALTLTLTPALSAPVSFDREVLPILSEYCFTCHGPDPKARKADLRLDTKDGALRTEEPVIVPGKSAMSELVRRLVTTDETEVMPPKKSKKPLNAKQIDTLKRWVDDGAPWGKHWAFEPPVRPAVPKLTDANPRRNPIDSFVQARLARDGWKPSPEADKTTLIRRVTLDLTGIPPTPAEVDAFLADRSQNAYERLVDRLLASPRFGERMVWEWLEAARYADSNGYQGDRERTMYPWRDWAIRSFNEDMPFDRFTVWQIAGDLLPNATPEQKLATAFLRNHAINGEGGRIAEENRIDYVMDMTETVGTVWLGLTFNCCRCHDHKFDPLLQKEYYGLFAFFNQTPVNGSGGDPQTKPVLDFSTPEQTAKLKELSATVGTLAKALETEEATRFPRDKGKSASDSAKAADLPKDVRDALKPAPASRSPAQLSAIEKHFAKPDPKYVAQLKQLRQAIDARDAASRAIPRVMVMEDQPTLRDTFILNKGLYTNPTDKVSAGVPGTLPPLPEKAKRDRLALANWLVSANHPLTARVTVNRFWAMFFGIGLVKTTEDFGIQGERPGYQDLLDWLAVEFREKGWSPKQIIRTIVTSHTYRQSSSMRNAELGTLRIPQFSDDPENRLLARGARYRMPSWMIRDQALAASGLLVEQLGGAPVKPYQPPGIWEEATFGLKRYEQDHGDALYRRSVYTFWRRIVGPTMFFDTAPRQTCTVEALRPNTPLHALATFNDITFVEAARVLAERTLTENLPTDAARIEFAFRRVLARKPTAQESQVLTAGLNRLRQQYATDTAAAKELLSVGEAKRNEKLPAPDHAAYTVICLTILNLDEALSKE